MVNKVYCNNPKCKIFGVYLEPTENKNCLTCGSELEEYNVPWNWN